ncbi:hypothetical protein [Pacificoceanicola onchidii]|uniref:hypothetical protein n=1 Tax=Pacificoceanicola onchidii TaxID=2562685 RepID=UPI0010A65F0B|nr:hypothetical protein [Pacificoceanicola onchidii]
MSFRVLNLTASLLFAVLCLTLILFPEVVYWLFQLQGNTLGTLLAKRAGALFLGLAVLCYFASRSNSNEAKRLVALSVGAAMSALAVLSLYELLRGSVGPGMVLAIVIETTMAFLYYRHWTIAATPPRQHLHPPQKSAPPRT